MIDEGHAIPNDLGKLGIQGLWASSLHRDRLKVEEDLLNGLSADT